jgi:DNA-binding XRE family transcriptional regulator
MLHGENHDNCLQGNGQDSAIDGPQAATRGWFANPIGGVYGCLKGNMTKLVRIRRKKYSRRMVKRAISIATLTAVGARLRMVRSVLGHNQAEWARRLLIKPQILNKWEQGARQPNIDTLVLICDSTGCTLDFIFRGQAGEDIGC